MQREQAGHWRASPTIISGWSATAIKHNQCEMVSYVHLIQALAGIEYAWKESENSTFDFGNEALGGAQSCKITSIVRSIAQ